MGLDTVEIVIRTEEVFLVDLRDDECGRVVTVGDLHRLVLSKITLSDADLPDAENTKTTGRSRLEDQYPALSPWTKEDAWATLVAIIHDQLQVGIDEITEHATFLDDLGCD
jgi:acyl carrier protein